MKRQPLHRLIFETAILAIVPFSANMILGTDPGFLALRGVPYLAGAPLFASFYGFAKAMPLAVISALLGFVIAPWASGSLDSGYWAAFGEAVAASAFLSGILTAGIAFVRGRNAGTRERLLARLRKAVRKAVAAERKADTLETVNRVLENRVSGQKDSITLLHSRVKKLSTLSLERALETILETVAILAGMTSGAVWVPDSDRSRLVPAATFGWDDDAARDVSIDAETTVEGYVIRNKRAFSARMTLYGSEFSRFDTARNVITLPIVVRGEAWGVLNVEDMPFECYSAYSESVISIVLSLAEPYLRDILEYDALHRQGEIDETTGLPLYPVLHSALDSETGRRRHGGGSVALVVIEMANHRDALGRWDRQDLKRLTVSLKDALDRSRNHKHSVFHYKEDNQFAIILPDTDQDGVSFFCLDALSMMAGRKFRIGDEIVPIEIVIGFSVSKQDSTADSMIAEAEHLLSLQRI